MADMNDDTGEPDMEPMPSAESAPDTKGIDPDLVREELGKGHCTPKTKLPKTQQALELLGAGKAYGQK